MSLKLYELAEGYTNILNMVDEDNPDADILKALMTIEGQIEGKAMSIVSLIKHWESESDIIKSEEQRLAKLRKTRENAVQNVKQYLKGAMEQMGLDELKSPTRSIKLQNNHPTVEITNIDLIPQKFLNFIPASYEPKKAEIAKACKDGEEILGVSVTQGKSLRIR